MKKENLKTLEPAALLQVAEDLFDANAEAEAKVKELTDALQQAGKDYAVLSKMLDVAESGKGQKTFGEVKVGKTTFTIVRPKVNFKGRIYTASELIENKELAEALVKIGASCLVEKQ